MASTRESELIILARVAERERRRAYQLLCTDAISREDYDAACTKSRHADTELYLYRRAS